MFRDLYRRIYKKFWFMFELDRDLYKLSQLEDTT